MSAAACAAGADGEIICTDAMSINKSYPDFYGDFKKIGGLAEIID
jgi:3-phosphoshikimate 1-carboxyvinyltransferase